MDKMTVTSVAELCSVIERDQFQDDNNDGTTVIYRGLSDIKFQLIPKAGRFSKPRSKGEPINEKLMFELFQRSSVGLTHQDCDNKWELIAVAQHHGMATRLMDWTRSPLVAAYFAVQNPNERYKSDEQTGMSDRFVRIEPSSVIYAWRVQNIDLSKAPPNDPFDLQSDVVRYVPRHVTPRIKAQSGLFSVHKDPRIELNDPTLIQLEIPFIFRGPIKKSLYRLGVHEATIYPDIDGTARHIEWLQTNKQP